MRLYRLGLVVIISFLGVLETLAQNWSANLVCAAGVHAYFYLKDPPRRIGELDDWTTYRSRSGSTYDCQIKGDKIIVRWSTNGRVLSSQSTSFSVQGNVLAVKPEGLSPWRFRARTNGYLPIE